MTLPERSMPLPPSPTRPEIRLLPENPDFPPILLRDLRDDEFHVIAEVVEVPA